MAQGFSQNSELDKMKADAIKRARQMHLRATMPSPKTTEHNADSAEQNKPKSQKPRFSMQGILEMTRMMGFESDQLILIALILMLSSEEDNFPLVLALLYIAL